MHNLQIIVPLRLVGQFETSYGVIKMKIPKNLKTDIDRIISDFNKTNDCLYIPRYKGRYLYLYRDDGFEPGPVCRLESNGKMNNWEFAIFKYSSESYDPDECFFPGAECVDGTIEGAMFACLEAYPF